MALPYPTKVVLPFDIATAQDMNERHANDVALANGSGLDDESITARTLAQSAKDDLVTKVSTGLLGGLGTTGVKSITTGFRPKYVKFTLLPTASVTEARTGKGGMYEDGTQWFTATAVGSSDRSNTSQTGHCIAWINPAGTTRQLGIQYEAMTDTGFEVRVTEASASFGVRYEAFG